MEGTSSRAAALLTMLLCAHAAGDAPRCASSVVRYVPGSGAGAAYQDPAAALGAPTMMTGGSAQPAAVTPFHPAWMPGEVVSVGRGGELVLAFESPVTDDPSHPYGIDLIIYGNAFCGDIAYPSGIAGWTFEEGGTVELSADGITWHLVPGVQADGGLPTLAWRDVGPYATAPGTQATDPGLPVDPSVTPASIAGLAWPELVGAYGPGAGGSGIDLAAAGLASARFVRVRTAGTAQSVPEVDAVVAVRGAARSPDLDGNGSVDGADLSALLGSWGACSCAADLDADDDVDGADLSALLGSWS